MKPKKIIVKYSNLKLTQNELLTHAIEDYLCIQHNIQKLEIIDFDQDGYPIYNVYTKTNQRTKINQAVGITLFPNTPKATFELHFLPTTKYPT